MRYCLKSALHRLTEVYYFTVRISGTVFGVHKSGQDSEIFISCCLRAITFDEMRVRNRLSSSQSTADLGSPSSQMAIRPSFSACFRNFRVTSETPVVSRSKMPIILLSFMILFLPIWMYMVLMLPAGIRRCVFDNVISGKNNGVMRR